MRMQGYKSRSTLYSRITRGLLIASVLLLALPAQAVVLTKGFTGVWQQSEHESQGFNFQVIDQNNGVSQAAVFWYTYDTAGNPMWLSGLGDIVGNMVEIPLMTVTGVTNLQANDPQSRHEHVLATAIFEFDDCDHGTVIITPSSVSGTEGEPNTINGSTAVVPIIRLTNTKSTDCSGGISDDTHPDDPDEQDDQFLGNTGVYPSGNARYHFEQHQGSSSFEVAIEDIPQGTYDLSVGGLNRGQIAILPSNNGTEGKLEFRSPATFSHPLLDFDPRGQLIEILEGTTVLFSSTIQPGGDGTSGNDDGTSGNGDGTSGNDDGTSGNGDGTSGNDDGTSGNDDGTSGNDDGTSGNDDGTSGNDDGAPSFGNSKLELSLLNAGVYPAASSKAVFEQHSNWVDFSVTVEDVPLGNYQLYVGGIQKATITVFADHGGNEGKAAFSNPTKFGELPLDFDPRGQLLEIRQGSTVVFSGDFTTQTSPDDTTTGAPAFGNAKIELNMFNTGVYASARGEVEFEQKSNRVEFSVKVERIPMGNYTLYVGGAEKATLILKQEHGSYEAKAEFSNPTKFGELPLDFDPRGQHIEVREGGTTLFQVDL